MPELPLTEPAQTTIEEPVGSVEDLLNAADLSDLKAVAANFPTCLAAWAQLGDRAIDDTETIAAYAFYRVGYHRGLDRIRQAGWRGKGQVPWAHQGNRGFLRCLAGLSEAAAVIGESDEAQRCRTFLADLAPDAPEDLLNRSGWAGPS